MKFTKIIVSLSMVVLALAATSKVNALQIKEAKVTLGDTRSAQTGVLYSFSFKHTSANTIKKITFDWCKVASDGGTNCGTAVSSAGFPSTALTGISGNLGVTGDWTTTVNTKMISIVHGTGLGVGANALLTFDFSPITNSNTSEACDATNGSDTCFIWIKTYQTNETSIVDQGVVTYTVVDAVTVEATVDPTFTFVVEQVAKDAVNNGITTSVATQFNKLPFGSLQAGTPKYAAHSLKVTTNTQGGYSVSATMIDRMTGVYTQNNIDPFVAPWTTPTTWTEPTGGVPNTDTGWIGANTTDTDITQWAAVNNPAGKFGKISDVGVVVSTKDSSDNGLTPVIVTYAIEANVFQPSDTYSGTLFYNALPTY